MVGWVDDNTKEVVIQDRWAHAKSTPTLDACQSWLSDGGFQNETHTAVSATRLRKTGDNSDRDIIEGPMKMVWAHSEYGMDTFEYHGAMRHAVSVEFFKDADSDLFFIDPTWKSMDVVMDSYTVPNEVTVYACLSFNLTQEQDKHIVRIDPIVYAPTAPMVHHFLLHQCETPGWYDDYTTGPRECISPLAPLSNCSAPIFGWGVGGGPVPLPKEAGYRLGTHSNPNHGMRYFILEVHYNSPDPSFPVNRTDRSGVRIYYTENLRPNDAGMMVLGDPFVTSRPILPQRMTHLEISCGSGCTSAMGHSFNVFASFQHMHSLGHRMWSTVHRGSTGESVPLHRIEFYDYNFQELGLISPQVVINPGDRIQTHCLFSSYSTFSNTKFGSASTDEMCMEFIAYWPLVTDSISKLPWGICGYADTSSFGNIPLPVSGNLTACGALNVDGLLSRISIPYATNSDPPGGEYSSFGVSNANGVCPNPLTGRVVLQPQTSKKSDSYDVTLIIWASVVGGAFLLIVLAGFIYHVTQKNALRPDKIQE